MHEDGGAAFVAHYLVVGVKVIVRAAGRGEDLAEQQAQPLGVDALHGVIGACQVDPAFYGRPLPARPDDDVRVGALAPVGELAGAADGDHPDHVIAGARMRQDTRVHHRRRDRAIGTGCADHDETMVACDQTLEILDVRHVII